MLCKTVFFFFHAIVLCCATVVDELEKRKEAKQQKWWGVYTFVSKLNAPSRMRWHKWNKHQGVYVHRCALLPAILFPKEKGILSIELHEKKNMWKSNTQELPTYGEQKTLTRYYCTSGWCMRQSKTEKHTQARFIAMWHVQVPFLISSVCPLNWSVIDLPIQSGHSFPLVNRL